VAEDSAGTDQPVERFPWVKPFMRNLDVEDTDGKIFFEIEFSNPYGPS